MNRLNNKEFIVDPYDPILSIGIAAKKVGVSPETLRLYEKEGLLVTHKTATGRRLYSQVDITWITCIRRQILNNKLNIAGIKRLLALIPCWEIKPCAIEDRLDCPAKVSNNMICWEFNNTGTPCVKADCRKCAVYHFARNVGHMKQALKKVYEG